MALTQVRYQVAPTTTPLKGTLLDLVTPVNGMTWQDGRDLYESYNCLKFDAAAQFCAPNNKDLSASAQFVSGLRFSAYGGITCQAVGMDRPEAVAQIERVFRSGESTAIERALMGTRFNEGSPFESGADAPWDAPTDITPASGAVTPKVGIALLEEFAGNTYVGRPTMHVPRSIGSLLLNENGAVWDGNALRTNLGSGLAAGAGYSDPNLSPTGAPAAVGERWIYATGEVSIAEGDLILHDEMSYQANDVVVLAERPYLLAVDCFTAAIRVKVEE